MELTTEQLTKLEKLAASGLTQIILMVGSVAGPAIAAALLPRSLTIQLMLSVTGGLLMLSGWLGLRVLRLQSELRRLKIAPAKDEGVKLTDEEFSILRAYAENGMLSSISIQKQLGFHTDDITDAVEKLKKLGFVEHEINENYSYTGYTSVTRRGRQFIRKGV